MYIAVTSIGIDHNTQIRSSCTYTPCDISHICLINNADIWFTQKRAGNSKARNKNSVEARTLREKRR
jgi:hypothetical protein